MDSDGEVEIFTAITCQGKPVCGKLECRHTRGKRMVVGRTVDVRCGGFNWKNKDRGE